MSDRFSEIMKSSDYVSTGSVQKDAAIIDTCRSNINKMFNPVDSKKNPLEVPDEHPLSRKSFENAGITFKD